jgi:hypothetical protein
VTGAPSYYSHETYSGFRPGQCGLGRKQESNLCLRVQTFEGDSNMTKLRLMFNLFAVSVVCLVCSSVAEAQATRTWVSGVGDDANPCSRTAPCKTFAGAISKTAAGGEISVLDPGGYGAVTITKALTIDGGTGAGWGSILVSAGGSGIIVNAGANDVVTLRNLSINGLRQTASPGGNGIRFLAGKALHVQDVNIFGFTTHGIDINLTANNGQQVTIQDTTIRECGGAGVRATNSAGNFVVAITNVQIDRCVDGVSAQNGSIITIRNSTLAENTTAGLNTVAGGIGAAVNLDRSSFINNGTGANVVAGATVRLNDNTFANNSTGVNNGGTVQSATNNKFMGNGTPTAGGAFGSFPVQ